MHGEQGIFGLPNFAGGLRVVFLKTPVRLLDTRVASTVGCILPAATLSASTEVFIIARGLCAGIPADAKGILGNVTVVNHVSNGFLTIWPKGATRPFTANHNFNTAIAAHNVAFVSGLGLDGGLGLYPSQTIDLILDVQAYLCP